MTDSIPVMIGPLTARLRELIQLEITQPVKNGNYHIEFHCETTELIEWAYCNYNLTVEEYVESAREVTESLKNPPPDDLGPEKVIVNRGRWTGLMFFEIMLLSAISQVLRGEVVDNGDGLFELKQQLGAAYAHLAIAAALPPNLN